ncbi:MAG: haloacid dehalogenase [Chloroflexota bacterium]|nr:haloacid dehalogenase [Chloroflexota bacterium]
MTQATPQPLQQITNEIIQRFDTMGAARDQAVTKGRQVVRLAANAVRAMHRESFDQATSLLGEASALLAEIRRMTAPFPGVYWAGYVQDAMKEYAEAELTKAMLRGEPLPDPRALQVEDGAYLNGLAEAASELRRDTLDALRANEINRALALMEGMDNVYATLVTVDFPDAVTGGLRRGTDQLRAVLERTRADVTVAVRQHRLEQALLAAEKRWTAESS